MDDLSAQRTLVKSPPELWAEISDVEALARHLGEFGDVRITDVEPETTVAWEGDRIRGTVNLEPSGWGTKVTLAAELLAVEAVIDEVVAEPEPEAVIEPEPEPVAVVEPEPEPVAVVETVTPAPAPRGGFFARMFGKRHARPVDEEPIVLDVEVEPVASEPEPEPEPEPVAVEPEPVAVAPEPEPVTPPLDADGAQAVLVGMLDDLGSAHHRPFSRG